MYLGMYTFRGDPAQLLAGHERLLASLPAGQLELHVCVQTEDGLALLDTCPSREVFDRFSTSHGFQERLAAAGLPAPEIRPLGEVRSYILPPPQPAP